MDLIFSEHVAICFHSCSASATMVASRCNAEFLAAVLVNPSRIEPVFRYRVVWAYKVKSFGIDTWRLAERFGVATQQEVGRFNLVREAFSLIETCQWPNNCRT